MPMPKISNPRDIPPNIGIKYHDIHSNHEFIPMPALDAIDRKILALLQSDSRMTMQELSDKVGLSVSPCHRRVKLLEERGVITRYIATVDQKSLGSTSASSSRSSCAAEGRGPQPVCESDLEMGRGAGVLSDDRQPRLPAARRRRRPLLL
jgi:DNA-binding Lrp family transcriptional regulator